MVWETEYVAFVEANWARYLRLARLLTGDRDRGEELLQDSPVRLYLRWRRAATRDPHAICAGCWPTATSVGGGDAAGSI